MPENQPQPEQWAVIDLMGHVRTAGRIEMGALVRVDVPVGDTYRTEFYGMAAIYSIKIVSEEIARASAPDSPDIMAYDAPIITRAEHEAELNAVQQRNDSLARKLREMERRLPAPDNEP